MTALKASQIGRFLDRPDLGSGFFLAYGGDPGLVREVAQRLARHCAGGRGEDIVVLEPADIEADPGRLAREARTPSLFGEAPVVRVRGATGALVPTLKEIKPDLGRASIILEAGRLGPGDALRRFIEAMPDARALPCWPDDERTLAQLARERFSRAGIAVAADVIDILVASLGNDREITSRELEKLELLGASAGRLTRDDVLALTADNGAGAFDEIVDAAGTGHAARLDAAISRALRDGTAQQVLSVTLMHFAHLRRWRTEIDAGRSAREVLDALRPKPHFSRVADLERQLRIWSDAALAAALARLQAAIADSRRASGLTEAVLRRTLLAIALMAAAS